MRYLTLLAVGLLVAHASESAPFWKRVAEPSDVAVTVSVVSQDELNEIRGHKNQPSKYGDGYSILTRNRDTGEWRCRVYVTAEHPKVIEHELRHCDGWTHG